MDKARPYIDFKLYMTRPADGQGACQVALLPTPEVGETVTPVIVPAEHAPGTLELTALARKSITLRQLVALGKQLGNCLLPEGTIRTLFSEALKDAGNSGGVRLRLVIADHALQQWPWEYAYLTPLGEADAMRGFLALDPRISFVRHEPLPQPHPGVTPQADPITSLRMVIAAAQPVSQRELDLEKEINSITTAIADFNVDGMQIAYEPVLRDATYDDLAAALRSSAYLFHFGGHGVSLNYPDPFTRGAEKTEGYLLLLEDKQSKAEHRLRADDLAILLQTAGVRLAVLSACDTGTRSERSPWDSVASALMARNIPAAVAMQYEVQDVQAVNFSEALYGALAAGLSLDEAIALARQAMWQLTNRGQDDVVNIEWGVPVLYSRLPDGRIFPERMAHAGATAQEFRRVIDQTVQTISEGGTVVGITARRVSGGFMVKQNAENVDGTLIGAELGTVNAEAKAHIEQESNNVSGSMIGFRADEI